MFSMQVKKKLLQQAFVAADLFAAKDRRWSAPRAAGSVGKACTKKKKDVMETSTRARRRHRYDYEGVPDRHWFSQNLRSRRCRVYENYSLSLVLGLISWCACQMCNRIGASIFPVP
jgi:hypothetical protein